MNCQKDIKSNGNHIILKKIDFILFGIFLEEDEDLSLKIRQLKSLKSCQPEAAWIKQCRDILITSCLKSTRGGLNRIVSLTSQK